jgi:hypothetical protein
MKYYTKNYPFSQFKMLINIMSEWGQPRSSQTTQGKFVTTNIHVIWSP